MSEGTQEGRVDDRNRWRMLGVLMVAVVAALLLPAIFGGRGDAWGGWVYDYQALIGGLLALGAAGVTVTEMRRSEAANWDRYRQDREERREPKKNKIERFCRLCRRRDFGYIPDIFGVMTEDPFPKFGDDVAVRDFMRPWIGGVSYYLDDLEDTLKHNDWLEAERLFSADLKVEADSLQSLISKMVEWTRECSATLQANHKASPGWLNPGEVEYYRYALDRIKHAYVHPLPGAIEGFLSELEPWAKANGVEFHRAR